MHILLIVYVATIINESKESQLSDLQIIPAALGEGSQNNENNSILDQLKYSQAVDINIENALESNISELTTLEAVNTIVSPGAVINCRNREENNTFDRETGTLNSNDESCRVLNRDTDTFYDNELIMKLRDNNGSLPLSLHIESANRDPILIYDETKKQQEQTILEKREVNYSENEDEYNDQSEDETSAIRQGLHGLGNNFAKNTQARAKSVHSTNQTGLSNQEIKNQKEVTQNAFDLNKGHINYRLTTTTQSQTEHDLENSESLFQDSTQEEPEFNNVWDESARNSKKHKIINLPKRRYQCSGGHNERINCLPSGGAPKNPYVPLTSKKNDTDYERVIKGDLIDKLVNKVLATVTSNSKMSAELGICPVDLKEVRTLYDNIRLSTTTHSQEKACCMKAVDELKCFLNWLLTIEASRKKRNTKLDIDDYEIEDTKKLYDKSASFSDLVGVRQISPEYEKLFQKVEQYKEKYDNPWNTESFVLE